MILKIHNDGKERISSFEVWSDLLDTDRGYGSTEEEAIEEYKIIVAKLLKSVTDIHAKIYTKKYDKILVDYKGDIV